jgi:hypothetical protein
MENTAAQPRSPGHKSLRHSEPPSRPSPLRGSTSGRALTPTPRWRLPAPVRESRKTSQLTRASGLTGPAPSGMTPLGIDRPQATKGEPRPPCRQARIRPRKARHVEVPGAMLTPDRPWRVEGWPRWKTLIAHGGHASRGNVRGQLDRMRRCRRGCHTGGSGSRRALRSARRAELAVCGRGSQQLCICLVDLGLNRGLAVTDRVRCAA